MNNEQKSEFEKAIDNVEVLLSRMSWRYNHDKKAYVFLGEKDLSPDTLFDALGNIASIVRWARVADEDLQLMGSVLSDVDKASFHQAKLERYKTEDLK